MLRDVGYVLEKLDWMRAEQIWPNDLRYLWTDAFGVVLYVSLYRELGETRWLGEAERLVADVDRVLGRTDRQGRIICQQNRRNSRWRPAPHSRQSVASARKQISRALRDRWLSQ